MAHKDYLEERNGGFYVAGTRVTLDSVIYRFREGDAPETILREFPALRTLENVYGAITSYLADRAAFDEYLTQQERRLEEIQNACDPLPPEFVKRLQRMHEERLQSVK